MSPGYAGAILTVDLTRQDTHVIEPSEELLRKYIGGSGLAARYLYDSTPAWVDPLDADNLLIFMTGPFTGTPVPTSGRHAVVTRSPLTGIFSESDIGGSWGTALKRAGYDGIIVRGRAPYPVYLVVSEDEVHIKDARHLWGVDTYDIEGALRKETNERAAVMAIGPAGERMVRFASIMSDGKEARAAGRTGVGAVMGSKNLKALVVWGQKPTEVAHPEQLRAALREAIPGIREGTAGRNRHGTAAWTGIANQVGDLPVKNWRGGAWEGSENLRGEHMTETILTGRYHCVACPIGCGRRVAVTEGKYAGVKGAGPEYESLGMLGSMLLIDDLEAVSYMTQLCNRYGMDTISTGGTLAFAFDCYEHGVLTEEQVGRPLEWGDADAAIALINDIATGKGIGPLLALGARGAAQELGGLAPEFAIHVKGMELPAHDARTFNSSAVAYATANRGACHLQALSYPVEISLAMPDLGFPEPLDPLATERKGELTAKMQDLMSILDSLKVCKFIVTGGGGIAPHTLVEWLNLVTGWDMTLDELLQAGERVFNLKRLYNTRLGISRKDDTLPPRLLSEPRPDGGGAGRLPPLGTMLHDYYEVRGWDVLGQPTPDRLARLGLQEDGVAETDTGWKIPEAPRYWTAHTH